nr:hypothetical protein [Planctomicrobium sp.]
MQADSKEQIKADLKRNAAITNSSLEQIGKTERTVSNQIEHQQAEYEKNSLARASINSRK